MPSLITRRDVERNHPVVDELGSNDLTTGFAAGGFRKPRGGLLSSDVSLNVCKVLGRQFGENLRRNFFIYTHRFDVSNGLVGGLLFVVQEGSLERFLPF